MALYDPRCQEVVIRVVYDGPPLAGKTTNLKTLAAILAPGRVDPVFSPEEADGRTLYFDWLDYVGGSMDGRPVRCQIVSVPGQPRLAQRRLKLLRLADVVVLVIDSARTELAANAAWFAALPAALGGAGGPGDPPIGIVVQANKQDLGDAASADEIRRAYGDPLTLSVIEGTATKGQGVREAFVFAVRLALDRVRALRLAGRLPEGPPEISSGTDLLRLIDRSEATTGAAEPLLREALTSAVEPAEPAAAPPASAARPGTPTPPNSRIPSGMVWPPILGRVALMEIESRSFELRQRRGGDWTGFDGHRWSLLSRAADSFTKLADGHRTLIEQARLHTLLGPLLAPRRVAALAETGDGRWRLWQAVAQETSLRDHLREAVAGGTVEVAAQGIVRVARALVWAGAQIAEAGVFLPLSLDTFGTPNLESATQAVGAPELPSQDGAGFIAFLPDRVTLQLPPERWLENPAEVLRRLLAVQLQVLLANWASAAELVALANLVERQAATDAEPWRETLARQLHQLAESRP